MVTSGESQQPQQTWRYCGGQIKLWRETLSTLTQRHGMIRMQALDVEESALFIRKVAEEL